MADIKQSVKMTPEEFTVAFYPYAKITQQKSGVSAIAVLAQAALESGWNSKSPGWMFFGEKDTDGVNGNEQLLTTTEYMKTPNAKFPVILSVTKAAGSLWKYVIKDYFKKFNTPEECFTKHASFFLNNKRYTAAVAVGADYNKFFIEIAKAGYATDPNYAKSLSQIGLRIENIVKSRKL